MSPGSTAPTYAVRQNCHSLVASSKAGEPCVLCTQQDGEIDLYPNSVKDTPPLETPQEAHRSSPQTYTLRPSSNLSLLILS